MQNKLVVFAALVFVRENLCVKGRASPPGSCSSVDRCPDLRQLASLSRSLSRSSSDNDQDKDRDDDAARQRFGQRLRQRWLFRLARSCLRRWLQQHVHDSVATAALTGASPVFVNRSRRPFASTDTSRSSVNEYGRRVRLTIICGSSARLSTRQTGGRTAR